MTEEEAQAATKNLADQDVVSKLLYLNSVRGNADIARDGDYQRHTSTTTTGRHRKKTFYNAFYTALYDAAQNPAVTELPDVLQKLCGAYKEKHLSFCSKLQATVRDNAVVFDANFAKHFGISTTALPVEGWLPLLYSATMLFE